MRACPLIRRLGPTTRVNMKLELGYNRRFVAVPAPLPRVQNTRQPVHTRLKSCGFRSQVSKTRLIARPWPPDRTPRGAPQYQASIEIRWAKFGRAPTPRSRVEAFLFFDLSFASARAAMVFRCEPRPPPPVFRHLSFCTRVFPSPAKRLLDGVGAGRHALDATRLLDCVETGPPRPRRDATPSSNTRNHLTDTCCLLIHFPAAPTRLPCLANSTTPAARAYSVSSRPRPTWSPAT